MTIVQQLEGGQVKFKANQILRAGTDPGNVEVGLHRIKPADEYWFHYWVKWEPGWIEGRGGKLPGLAGGKATSGGADVDPEGWSSRIMWGDQRDGMREYRYDNDRQSKYGASYPWADWARYLEVDKWHRIVQFIRINTPDKNDGVVRFWLNGQTVLRLGDVKWRGKVSDNKARVDRVRMSIFRGGGTPDWAVPRDTYASFSDFYVLNCKPDMSHGNPHLAPVCEGREPDLALVATIELGDGVTSVISGNKIRLFQTTR